MIQPHRNPLLEHQLIMNNEFLASTMINEVAFWIIMLLNMLTYTLAGEKSGWTWHVGCLTQLSWVVWQFTSGNDTFWYVSLALLAVNFWNLLKWRRAGSS